VKWSAIRCLLSARAGARRPRRRLLRIACDMGDRWHIASASLDVRDGLYLGTLDGEIARGKEG